MTTRTDARATIDTVMAELRASLLVECLHALRATLRLVWTAAPVAAILMVVQPSAGFAQGTPEERAACIPDAFRLCSSQIPSADKVIACLKTSRAQLSSPCRMVMKKNGTI